MDTSRRSFIKSVVVLGALGAASGPLLRMAESSDKEVNLNPQPRSLHLVVPVGKTIPIITSTDLAKMRQSLSKQFIPVIWTKNQVNISLTACDTILVAAAFDGCTLLESDTTTNLDAQIVEDALVLGVYSAEMIPIVESWLIENPASITTRSINDLNIDTYVASVKGLFIDAVEPMPSIAKDAVIKESVSRHVIGSL